MILNSPWPRLYNMLESKLCSTLFGCVCPQTYKLGQLSRHTVIILRCGQEGDIRRRRPTKGLGTRHGQINYKRGGGGYFMALESRTSASGSPRRSAGMSCAARRARVQLFAPCTTTRRRCRSFPWVSIGARLSHDGNRVAPCVQLPTPSSQNTNSGRC